MTRHYNFLCYLFLLVLFKEKNGIFPLLTIKFFAQRIIFPVKALYMASY